MHDVPFGLSRAQQFRKVHVSLIKEFLFILVTRVLVRKRYNLWNIFYNCFILVSFLLPLKFLSSFVCYKLNFIPVGELSASLSACDFVCPRFNF